MPLEKLITFVPSIFVLLPRESSVVSSPAPNALQAKVQLVPTGPAVGLALADLVVNSLGGALGVM